MISHSRKNSKKIVTNVFIITTLITIIITSVSLTVFFEAELTERTYKSHRQVLDSAQESFRQMNDIAKNILVLFYNDQNVQNLLTGNIVDRNTLIPQIVDLTHMYISLDSMPDITMYLVDFSHESVFTIYYIDYYYKFDDFFDKEILTELNEAEINDRYVPRFRRIEYTYTSKNKNVITYYFFEGGSIDYSDTAIVVNLDSKWLGDKLESLTDIGESIFICDPVTCETIFTSDPDSSLSMDIAKQLSSASNISQDMLFMSGGRKYLLSFEKNEELDYIFTKVTDYGNISKTLVNLRVIIIIIILLLIVIGGFISRLISRNLYSTVDKELKILYGTPPKIVSAMLTSAFNEFTTSGMYEEELSGDLKNGIIKEYNIDVSESLVLILIRIDDSATFCRENNKTYSDAIRYGILNIAEEVYSSEHSSNGAVLDKQSVLLMLSNVSGDHSVEKLIALSEKIQIHINEIFEISVSVFISKSGNLLSFGSLVFDVNATADLRFINGYGSIIIAESVDKRDEFEADIPRQITAQLNELIFTSDYARLRSLLQQSIFNDYKIYSVQSLKETISLVAANLKQDLYRINRNSMLDITSLTEILDLIPVSETMDSVINGFNAFFDNRDTILSNQESDNTVTRHQQYVDMVCRIVETNFHNYDFSIDDIAESMNLSTIYVSRIFKNTKNISLSNYINEVRIQKASELLVKTNLSAQKISRLCGLYNRNYFYTLFKKHKNITAAEYRRRFGVLTENIDNTEDKDENI